MRIKLELDWYAETPKKEFDIEVVPLKGQNILISEFFTDEERRAAYKNQFRCSEGFEEDDWVEEDFRTIDAIELAKDEKGLFYLIVIT